MVVSSHHLAAQAGLRVLQDGGNAVEAMVAAAATISVVYPHMNGIGGDGFWLIDTPGWDRPRSIMGVGRAAQTATGDWYAAQGADAIPGRGPLAANTVAGTVSGWDAALRVAADWGTPLPVERLLEDAIFYARNGMPVTAAHCVDVAGKADQMDGVPGWHDLFRADGDPAPGQTLKQPALAETLTALGREGLDAFYRGALAGRIAADLATVGSPVAAGDLAAHQAIEGAPLHVETSAGTIYNTPPPTQGLVSLLILALYDRMRATDADGFDHVHRLVEATKQAFLVRDAWLTDPDYMGHAADTWLGEDALSLMSDDIDPAAAMPWPQPMQPGDTVWLGAVDDAGRAVSFIHSIYWEFGSGVVLPETGIQWQNRGSSFSLDPEALNFLRPGRLPFHTNNPALARLADGRLMLYGTMGGDGQPQTQSAVFSRHAMHGVDLQAAITAPRWLLGRRWGEEATALRLERRMDPALRQALADAGHEIDLLGDYDALVGHAGALVRHTDGRLEGATDPRADGTVAAF
jgi:gamma-glutamyltranspeptidase/glutathione hydrolase